MNEPREIWNGTVEHRGEQKSIRFVALPEAYCGHKIVVEEEARDFLGHTYWRYVEWSPEKMRRQLESIIYWMLRIDEMQEAKEIWRGFNPNEERLIPYRLVASGHSNTLGIEFESRDLLGNVIWCREPRGWLLERALPIIEQALIELSADKSLDELRKLGGLKNG